MCLNVDTGKNEYLYATLKSPIEAYIHKLESQLQYTYPQEYTMTLQVAV